MTQIKSNPTYTEAVSKVLEYFGSTQFKDKANFSKAVILYKNDKICQVFSIFHKQLNIILLCLYFIFLLFLDIQNQKNYILLLVLFLLIYDDIVLF